MTGVELLKSRFAVLELEADEQGPGDENDNADWDAAVDAAVKEMLASNNATAAASANSSGNRRRKSQIKCDEDIEQEFLQRYMWLIDDINESRKVITETWSLYLAGVKDLETAALTTMIAFDNIQFEHDRLADKYSELMASHVKYACQACAQNGRSSEVNQNGDYCHVQVWHRMRAQSAFGPG